MSYDTSELRRINTKIERLNQTHHADILRLVLSDSSIKYTENKNGVFVNMKEIPPSIMERIQKYLDYVENNEVKLRQAEQEKIGMKQLINCNN